MQCFRVGGETAGTSACVHVCHTDALAKQTKHAYCFIQYYIFDDLVLRLLVCTVLIQICRVPILCQGR